MSAGRMNASIALRAVPATVTITSEAPAGGVDPARASCVGANADARTIHSTIAA
jgi:hypothetical protein